MHAMIRRSGITLTLCVLACSPDDVAREELESLPQGEQTVPDILATNAFYYYADVETAWTFYTDVMGFETAADYGFAKIMRVAEASYLTLVDEARGMHSSEEPKGVTLALVTEQVELWYDYLQSQGVPMRADFNYREAQPHDGFVAVDPEGCLIEVERFNEHEENVGLLPRMARYGALGPAGGQRPVELEVRATVLWLYYDDVPGASAFYEELLGEELIVDQGWAKVYPASGTGYIGLVDGARGLHQATEEKGVTVSFFTSEVETWFDCASAHGIELRAPGLTDESGRVSVFVGYDPEGYFLEWDTFLDVEGNERLFTLLTGSGA
jgi:catechol 2,3-dioxygenase-like lactoylglutathione lyase family enzyme